MKIRFTLRAVSIFSKKEKFSIDRSKWDLFQTQMCTSLGQHECVVNHEFEYLYFPKFFRESESQLYFSNFLKHPTLSRGKVFLFGKCRQEPRLRAWFQENGKSYTYSRQTLMGYPFDSDLNLIRSRIMEIFPNLKMNSCLLNVYPTGSDSMGWHSDNEPELGEDPVVVSVSFGAERAMLFRLKSRAKGLKSHRLVLENCSLLLMGPGSQSRFDHSIPKVKNDTLGPRVNLTFRHFVDE